MKSTESLDQDNQDKRHQAFADDLNDLIKEHEKNGDSIRPFVCDGYPMNCKALIVGINPATVSKKKIELSSFWRNARFDKAGWLDAYREEKNRSAEADPEKKKKSGLSKTRLCIHLAVAAASPFRCLETNVYSIEKDEPDEDWKQNPPSTEIFQFLLKRIKPKAILIHGGDTLKALKRLTEFKNVSEEAWQTSQDRATKVKINSRFVVLRVAPHFSRLAYWKADSLGAEMVRELRKVSNKK